MQHTGPLVPGTWGGGNKALPVAPVLQHELCCARFSKWDRPIPYGYVSLRHCCRAPLALSRPPPCWGRPYQPPNTVPMYPACWGGGLVACFGVTWGSQGGQLSPHAWDTGLRGVLWVGWGAENAGNGPG